jgi:hypothetical protein
MARPPSRLARPRDCRESYRQEQRGKYDDREISSRPGHAQTFSCPKDAERGQHHADGEFERVLGNPRQRAMDHKTRAGDKQARRKRTRACSQQAAAGACRDHDEDDLESFEKNGLEAGQRSKPIEPGHVAACLPAQICRLGRESLRVCPESLGWIA